MKLVNFNASPEEIEKWKEQAYQARISLSAWIRSRLNDVAVGLQEPPKQLPPARKKVQAAGQQSNRCPIPTPRGQMCKFCRKTH